MRRRHKQEWMSLACCPHVFLSCLRTSSVQTIHIPSSNSCIQCPGNIGGTQDQNALTILSNSYMIERGVCVVLWCEDHEFGKLLVGGSRPDVPSICTRNSVLIRRADSLSPSFRDPHNESTSSMKMMAGRFSRAISKRLRTNLSHCPSLIWPNDW